MLITLLFSHLWLLPRLMVSRSTGHDYNFDFCEKNEPNNPVAMALSSSDSGSNLALGLFFDLKYFLILFR